MPDDAPQDGFERLNEQMLNLRMRAYSKLVNQGMEAEEAAERAARIVDQLQDDRADEYAGLLLNDGRDYSATRRTYAAGFNERLRTEYGWAEGLDILENMIGIIETASRACIARNRESISNPESPDELLDVLAQLNGQAIRVGREMHLLLSAGFPLGALSLSRTLYEIAVRASVLADYGREPGHEDLARRFILHAKIANLSDAETFQRDAETLGYEPFEEEAIQRLSHERNALVKKYDEKYARPYGWAAELPGVSGRGFGDLEKLAQTTHRRGIYKWSSHLVHADARSLFLSRVERGGGGAVLTDATNTDLFAPAEHAMYALNITFAQLVTAVDDPAPGDMFVAKALQVLLEQARDALGRAEDQVEAAETRLQSELAAEGKRMTPWGVAGLEDDVTGSELRPESLSASEHSESTGH